MGLQKSVEDNMQEYLVKNAPVQIPPNGRKVIADISPILALIGAVLSFLGALGLWNAGHRADQLIDYVNTYSRAYGGQTVHNLTVTFYIALVFIVLQGVILAAAYPGLRARSKKGWDLLLLGTGVSLLYNVLYMFTDYGGFGGFIFSLIGTLIGLYLLAQIRDQYNGKGKAKAVTPPAEPSKK